MLPQLPQRIISALIVADFQNRYYAVCKAHSRFGTACKCPHPEVLKALDGVGVVKKLGGPGRVYSIRQPEKVDGLEFSFIIQSGVTIEPCLCFSDIPIPNGTNYAVLARYVNEAQGKAMPSPPYPRPLFYSPAELRDNLALDVGDAFYA